MRNKAAGLKLAPLLIAGLCSLPLALTQGCATRRTVTTTTETSPASASTPIDSAPTTTTETTTSEEPDSVLGASAHFVWTVVSFPFRLIGDAFDLIV